MNYTNHNFLLFLLLIACGVVGSIKAKKLTVSGAFIGGLLALFIFLGVGWTGVIFMSVFFLLGTAATSWGRKEKEKLGIAQEAKGRRNLGQVLANGGAGGLIGIAAILFPQHAALCTIMIAAAFSSATADTLSSELGSIYGTNFYDILSFKKGERGRDGVISLEGLAFGMAGSAIIALIYAVAIEWNAIFFWIVIAGTIGNLADSVLGATIERKGIIGNDAVNFLNTAAAAAIVLLFI